MPLRPASTFIPSRSPIVGKDGNATFPFIKILQDWDTRISNGFGPNGVITGDILPTTQISGRAAIGTILQYIDDGGQVLGNGINFSRDYINKDTDHIADGLGSPLAGGRVAYSALVDSMPVEGQTIRYDGSDWLPVPIAIAQPASANKWIDSYDDATGEFTASQPDFSDISGTAVPTQVPPLSSLLGSVTPAQVPALSALSGRITTGQLPTAGISVTITTAALTPGGTNGSMTFVNGLLTAQVQAT